MPAILAVVGGGIRPFIRAVNDGTAGSKGETDMVNSHGRFVWYELMTTDMEGAKAFYANVVGWGARGASTPGPAYSLFTIGESPVAGLMSLPQHASRTGVTPHWIGYVGVDDVDAAVDRIKHLGGAVHAAPGHSVAFEASLVVVLVAFAAIFMALVGLVMWIAFR